MSDSGERPRPTAYRPCVGIALTDGAGRLLVARRKGTPDAWQMPQGGIDAGETPLRAALREMAEELGTDKAEPLAESADWLVYDLPEPLIGRIWGGRYRGQRQKWLLLRFTGRDADIDLATAHPEFDAWRWATPAEVLDGIVPFKRAVYDRVLAEFLPQLRPASR